MHGSLRGIGVDALNEIVSSLPPWQKDLDDDSAWMRPTWQLGLTLDKRFVEPPYRLTDRIRCAEVVPVQIDPHEITATGQSQVRLDAIAFYLDHQRRAPLFDMESWYGQDLPLVMAHQDGTRRILDGNHRIAAALVEAHTCQWVYLLQESHERELVERAQAQQVRLARKASRKEKRWRSRMRSTRL